MDGGHVIHNKWYTSFRMSINDMPPAAGRGMAALAVVGAQQQ